MTYQEYKRKVFAERPDVKTEYDKLEPEFEVEKKKIQQALNCANAGSKRRE